MKLLPPDLEALLRGFPRAARVGLPTPLQPADRLGERLGVSRLWLKRDDLTGLGLGGNKSRGLEFVLGDAVATGCDVLVAGGGVEQSNHAVQCAAAANRAGLESVVVLRRRPGSLAGGNNLIRDLLAPRVVWVDSDPALSDRHALESAIVATSSELADQGRRPYTLHSSLHPLTVIGYVAAVLELMEQLPDPWRPVSIYLASEGAALAGLVLGSRLLGLPWSVSGIGWRPLEGPTPVVLRIIDQAAGLLGLDSPVTEDDLVIHDGGGPAYGVCSERGRQAMRLAAELEAVVLDPVYSAKGLAGMISDLAEGSDTDTVFIHTGGVGATFAYGEDAFRESSTSHLRWSP